jgi:hypothetical protein
MSTTAADSIAGVEIDVLGIDRDALSPEALEAITAAHPRPDFKRLEHFDPSFGCADSSISSATPAGLREMHSDSIHLRPPKRPIQRVTNRSRGRPTHRVSESVDYLSLLMPQR